MKNSRSPDCPVRPKPESRLSQLTCKPDEERCESIAMHVEWKTPRLCVYVKFGE